MRWGEFPDELCHIAEDFRDFKLCCKFKVRLNDFSARHRHQIPIFLFVEIQADNREWLKRSAKATLHPARAFGNGAHKPRVARQANYYSISLSEVVATQDNGIGGDQVHNEPRSGGLWRRNEIQNPAEEKGYRDKFTKNLNSVDEPLTLSAFCRNTEHNRRQGREDNHPQNVSHGFLPAAISNASSMTR